MQMSALECALCNPFHTVGNSEIVSRKIARDKVNFLGESLRFNQGLIIGVVVIQHGHRLPLLITEDQYAITIQRSHPFWSNHSIQSTVFGPFENRIEQSRCR